VVERKIQYILSKFTIKNIKSIKMCKLKINRRGTTNETDIRQGVTKFCLGLYNNRNNIEIKRDFFKEMLIVQQENTYAPFTLNDMWNAIKSVRVTIPGPDGICNLCIRKL
jgi:vacuolar-type H+-ATPase subunit C/Vma6